MRQRQPATQHGESGVAEQRRTSPKRRGRFLPHADPYIRRIGAVVAAAGGTLLGRNAATAAIEAAAGCITARPGQGGAFGRVAARRHRGPAARGATEATFPAKPPRRG